MDKTKIKSKKDSSEHELEFIGGYLSCSCGWKSETLFWKIADVNAASQRHLDSVKVEEGV